MLPVLVPADLAHARAVPVHAQEALAVPVAPVLVPVDPVLVLVALVLVPEVRVARPWADRVPVALVARVPVVDPEVPVDPVARVPVVREATVRMVSVVHRARSRVPVDVGTWMSCSRS